MQLSAHAQCGHPQGRALRPPGRPRVLGCASRTGLEQRAADFYERGWGGDAAFLEGAVSEGHRQHDAVWVGGAKEGRAQLLAGIARFRQTYPDLRFRVLETAQSTAEPNKVFVHWETRATYEGAEEGTRGLSLLRFDGEGRVRESHVYRQATRAELARAAANPRAWQELMGRTGGGG